MQVAVVPKELLQTVRYQHLVFDRCFTTTYQGRLAVFNVHILRRVNHPLVEDSSG